MFKSSEHRPSNKLLRAMAHCISQELEQKRWNSCRATEIPSQEEGWGGWMGQHSVQRSGSLHNLNCETIYSSDKRYDRTGSYITPFYSTTFYSAPHSPSVQHWASSEVTWVSASYPRILWHADSSSKGSTHRASAVTLSTHVCESCHAICVLCSECPGSSMFPVCDLSQ